MSDTKDKSQIGYIVQERNNRFEVCVVSGRTVMVCEDESSASHYLSLLNEAHRAGYKSGYRDGHNK